jgi:hypothetical protein
MKASLSAKAMPLLLLSCSLMCAPRVAEARPANDKYNAAGITDAAAADKFFTSLQRAVALNQKSKVALMVSFPLRVRAGGGHMTLKHPSALLRHYNVVFNRKVKRALATQRSANLFSNWQGVMIGRGEIWFNQMPGKPDKPAVFKITAINN